MSIDTSMAAAGRKFDDYLRNQPSQILDRDSSLSFTVSLGGSLPPAQADDSEAAVLMLGEMLEAAQQVVRAAIEAISKASDSLNCTTKGENTTRTTPDGVTTTTVTRKTTCRIQQ